MTVVTQLATMLAPWQSLYSDSKVVSASVTGTHLLALLGSGGLALGADRSTLRALGAGPEARSRQLAELHAVHRPVLAALVILFLSGLLLAAADIDTFVASPVFWIKLALVALLLLNGALLAQTEGTLRREGEVAGDRLWRRLRLFTWCSLALWLATTVAGTVLTSAA